VKFVRGDLANWSSVLNAVKDYKPESIFHFGSMLSVPSDADPWSAYRVNANGIMHVLKAARLFVFDVEKVIFTNYKSLCRTFGRILQYETFDMWLPEEYSLGVAYSKDAAGAVIDLHDAPKENIKTMIYNIIVFDKNNFSSSQHNPHRCQEFLHPSISKTQ
jgi:hypothetical protein